MSQTLLCVICLRTDKILRTVEQALFNFHDELCDFSLVMGKQAQYCLECEWKLRKFHKFKQMCIKADKILQTLQQSGLSNKSLFQKPLFPLTLERSNGRNSKTFNYVYVDKKTSEYFTNTGYRISKPMPKIKYDSNIRGKHISSPHRNKVPMKKIVRVLNSVSGNAVTATAIPRNKIIIVPKNKYAKSVNYELNEDIGALGDKHNADNVDCLDDSNEVFVGTLSCNINDEKDNANILNDNLVTDTIDLLSEDEDNNHVSLLRDTDVASATYNADTDKTKNVVMEDTKTSVISKNYTEKECNNDMESQKSIKIKKYNLAEVACVGLGQKLNENETDVAHYLLDYNAELRIKTDSSEIEQHEQKVIDESRKTSTELTNADILSDDQEVKTMYVFDKEKYDLLKKNNVHTNNMEFKEERVEFAPAAVVKEEDIQYCEVLLQNDDNSKMELETGNLKKEEIQYCEVLLQNDDDSKMELETGITLPVSNSIKSLVKKDVKKITKLSKERKEYFNLLSFVKFDKTKNVVMEDTKTSVISKNYTEKECNNDMESQKSIKIKKYNLAEVACVGLGQKLNENETDVAHYPLDYNAELRIKTDSSEIEQHELKVIDESKKTSTELTNADILSDDQEVKTMYVFDKEKYDLLKENNVHTNNMEFKEERVEFAPAAVVKEEEIQYCEVLLQNDDNSKMELETGNVMQSYETIVVANEADETNVNETEENKDVADEMEQNDTEFLNLSTNFKGTLMQRKVYIKLRKMFKQLGEIKTADGDVISKDTILNFYGNMENGDKWKIAKAIAGRKKLCPPEAAQILWKLQQKYDKEYASIFDIEYLNTEEKVRGEFLQRKTSSVYLKNKFKCELCIKPFHNQKSLDYHKKWHDPSYGDYVCDLCQTRYKSKVGLYTHSQLHKFVYKCKLCPLITNRKTVMMSHSMHHKGLRVKCKICGQFYRNGSSINQHMMLHSRDHECNMCARNFASPLGLKAHKRFKHENVDVMQSSECTRCDLCGGTYISHEVYLKHYQKVHDATAQTYRTVRALGDQWRKTSAGRKEPVKKPPKRRNKHIFTEHPSTTESTTMAHQYQERRSSQTFAAAMRAIETAKYNNMLREKRKTDAIALMAAENSIDEQHMTLVYEDDEDVTNSMNGEMVYVYEEGNA